MKDMTDPFASKPNTADILSLFELDKDKWSGAKFRYMGINDVSYNHVLQAEIAAEDKWFGNELERDRDIKSFKAKVQQILEDTLEEKIGRGVSSIFSPAARELNAMSKSSSQKRILLLFSDLMENTAEVNFYNPQTLSSIKRNPKKIQALLEQQVKLEPLNDIEVYIIYQPQATKTNREFQIVSEFYKNILESKGAKVFIGANLIM
jgi:hypothetical protein